MNTNPRPNYPKPKAPPMPPKKESLVVEVNTNLIEHKLVTDFGTPTEYETFLLQREAFIAETLEDQDRLAYKYIVYKVTRKDLIELASNPVEFATLQKVIAVLSASLFLSVELES